MIARSRALGPEKIAISKAAVIISPLDVPVAGSLAILEQECWVVTRYAHILLADPPAKDQNAIGARR